MVSDDKRITAILNDTLADKRPIRSASTILSTARKPRPVASKLLAGIAAALVATLLIASFWVPGLARAISSAPLFGDAYLTFMKGTGMDIAYQAGFVTELGSQVTADGITLTVLGAYSDPTQGVVMFSLSSEEQGLMCRLWEFGYPLALDPSITFENTGSPGFNLTPVLMDAGSGSSSLSLDVEEDVIYGIMNMKPQRRIFSKKMTLSVYVVGIQTPPWTITFPVQTITKCQLETVRISESFAYGEETITLDELVFTPAQTILRFTIKGGEQQGSSVSKVISGSADTSHERLGSQWSILLADGSELRHVGGGQSGSGEITRGEASFVTTKERELTVLFEGFARLSTVSMTLPLKEGAKFATPTGDLELGKVVVTHDHNTEVEIFWHDATSIRKLGATIIGPAGADKYAIEGMRHTETGAVLIFGAVLEQDISYELYLDNIYTEDRTSLIVYELKP